LWKLSLTTNRPHVQEAAQTSPILLHEPAAAHRRGKHRLLADIPPQDGVLHGLRRRLALLAHWYAADGRLGARDDAALAIQVRLGHKRVQLHLGVQLFLS
jgi:hypothetical protein